MGVDARMLVKTRKSFTPIELRKLSVKLTDCFGSNHFRLWEAENKHALELVTEYWQDGNTIYPENGETFIEVNLMGRYYGEGYERGDIITYLAVAEWLEFMIPDAKIFYGGDSSGIYTEQFDRNARNEMFKYFANNGHKPYQSAFGSYMNDKEPKCSFCADTPMNNVGGGGGDNYYCCGSCGKKVIKTTDEEIHPVSEYEDFFDAHDKLRKCKNCN